MDLSLEQWEGITSAEREAFANRLTVQLPSGFAFCSIELCQLGEQQHNVAFYQQRNARFALIPGGTFSLGYDANQQWEPNPDELESWKSTADEYCIDLTIQAYIERVTLRPRQTELAPFLIETTASALGWVSIEIDDPGVQEILAKYRSERSVQVVNGETTTRVRREADGAVIAERSLSLTHESLVGQLGNLGFRFPTSDEWELACGGGGVNLFRWGNHVPCDRYPTDISLAEAGWRRQWVQSGGKLEYPLEGFASTWDLHRRPSSFGLFIASNPYDCELVAEIGITRGGDGGCTICGGTGFFAGWLTLATSYFEDSFCRHDPAEAVSPGYTVGRRVLDLR